MAIERIKGAPRHVVTCVSCVWLRSVPSILPMRKEPYIVLDLTAGQVFEHICLESDDVITAARRDGRMGPSFRFVSRVLRRETELAFITDHRLTVRLRRRRKPMRQHIVDLRFIDADAIVERRFDWRTLLAASWLASCRFTVTCPLSSCAVCMAMRGWCASWAAWATPVPARPSSRNCRDASRRPVASPGRR